MEGNQVDDMAIADAESLGRELGHTSGALARRYRRPYAAPDNLFSGSPSAAARAESYLLALDRDPANAQGADLWIARYRMSLARQRAEKTEFLSPDGVVAHLAQSFICALDAYRAARNLDERERALLRAEAAINRAICFEYQQEEDEPAGPVALRLAA